MAAAPVFAVTPKVGVATLTTGQTDRTGATATNMLAVLTAGASGTKINEVVVKAQDDPADSIVILFINDGTTKHIFDEVDLGDPADGTTTVRSFRESRVYDNLVIPTGYSLWALITVTPTAGAVVVTALGADL